MPSFKLEKLYDIKRETLQKLSDISNKDNTSKRFITSKLRKTQSKDKEDSVREDSQRPNKMPIIRIESQMIDSETSGR